MTWIAKIATGQTGLDGAFNLLPAAHEKFQALIEKLWDGSTLSPVVVELCRLRIAGLMRCAAQSELRHPASRTAGLGEDKIVAIPSYATSPLFTALERSAIAFAEQYVIDPHGLTDEDFAKLHAVMNEREIAALVLATATFDALMRMSLALDASSEAA